MLQILVFSDVYNWVYINTDGSLLIINLLHAASNTTIGLLPVLPSETGGDIQPLQKTITILFAIALLITIKNGSKLKM